ncbi:(Fe-S)-binding protein, partial [Deltaproteobacteria bacterium OttesenSCG-928-K17]|nr:(Fe-S)-binding protein [Deltaproteobacteria bacterium OttesenSCG-928-K17]
SARGRIRLVRLLNDGQYDWRNDPGISEKVDDCLLCRACVVNCPASVETDRVMLAARRDFLEIKGLSLFQKLVYRGALSHRERLDRASALMRLYEKSGLRKPLYAQALRKALDRLVYFDSFLPADLEPPARQSLPAVIKPAGETKMKAAFFIGCASNVFGARTVRVLVNYLAGRGVEIHLPKVGCCGAPHHSAGDESEARRLAAKNMALIFKEDYDFIISDCSTCAHALAHYDEFFGADSPEAEKIRPLLPRVMDVNTLIIDHLGLPREGLRDISPAKVTYHDSCHAVRGLNVKAAPREILKAVPGLTFTEMREADSCCGGAGSYGFSHPEMSGRIAAAKIANIKDSGADLLAVSCPACALQLGAGLRRAGLDINVLHPVELLARAHVIDEGAR